MTGGGDEQTMNQETRDSLNTIFGIPVTDPQVPDRITHDAELVPTDSVPTDSTVLYNPQQSKEDVAFSREKLRTLATQSEGLLTRAVEVAQQTDKASNFEAASALIQAVIQVHKELRDLHKHSREIDLGYDDDSRPPSSVNIEKGVVFSGSPSDLLKLMDPSRK